MTCSLLAVETIFENALATLLPEEIISLFSSLVFEEKGRLVTEPSLTPTMAEAHKLLVNRAKNIAQIQVCDTANVESKGKM